jgi:putative ABC transport system permease protein
VRRLLFRPLAWLTDRALADAMLGDLEELRARRARESRVAATLHFWRAALGLLLYALGSRLSEGWRAFRQAPFGGSNGDIRHALRTLRRNPAFAAAAVVLLALGIGANTAVYSVVRAVMLKPLPYDRPEDVVLLWGSTNIGPSHEHRILTGTHVTEIVRHNTTLESVAAFKSWETGLEAKIDLQRPDGTERLRGAEVTPNFFELLGVRAARGRAFSSNDTALTPIAVISHGLWLRRFGSDPAVVGAQISIAGGRQSRDRPDVTIIGVLPADFRFTYPMETEIYLLKPWGDIRPGRSLEYGLVGRLRPGVSSAASQAELTVLAQNIIRGYGFPPEHLDAALSRAAIMVEPAADHLVAQVRTGLTVLAGVAGLVLVIACVNIGLLFMSRTIDRTAELAVRAALGAGAGRIARLLLMEGVVLALVGGAGAVALTWVAQPIVRTLMPEVTPRADQIAIDAGVLLFAAVATLVTGLVAGVTPWLILLRRDLLTTIRRAGRTSTADRGLLAIRSAIVGLQVAAVIVLLVGAGLLLHSFWRLQSVPLGFEADDVLTLETRLLNPKYRSLERISAFEEELLARVRQLPGVSAAGLSTAVPMRGVDFISHLGPKGRRTQWGYARHVDAAYFEIMRIPLVRGRVFSSGDRPGAPRVMVVSESYAVAHFGQEDPIGRRLMLGKEEIEIVGVVRDVRYASVDREAGRAFYLPRAQNPAELICLLVRPQPGMQAEVAAALGDVVRRIDPEQPIQGLTTIGDLVSASTADRRFYAVSTIAFAGVALLLAVGGVFGVVSRSVAERRREIAIRMAIGADSRNVLRMVVVDGLLPVVIGCLVGLLVAHAAARSIEALLFEITPADPVTFGVSAALVLLVALTACLAPALRVSRMAPMATLKTD